MRFVQSLFLVSLILWSCTVETAESQMIKSSEVDILRIYRQEKGIDARLVFFDLELRKQGSRTILTGNLDSSVSKHDLLDYLSKSLGTEIEDSSKVLHPLRTAYVNVSVCNVRAEPAHSAELITQHLMGYPVRVYRHHEKGWLLCKGPDDYIGWIEQLNLTDLPSDTWLVDSLVVVTALESSVTEKSKIVSDLVKGNVIKRIQKFQAVSKIMLPDGRVGFVTNDHIAPISSCGENSDMTRVIQVAELLMGRPYMWGGTSTKAMDCSGLTRTVFLENGIMLERDASLQVLQGHQMDPGPSFSNLQAGDLLFFGRLLNDGSQRVTHVAIHVEGGRFIHASGLVNVQSLNTEHEDYSPYRAESFLQARRMVLDSTSQLRTLASIFQP